MGTLWIKELTGGLDVRKLPETSPGGGVYVARDGHFTRGGEFEKRPSFPKFADLPAETVGLAFTAIGLVVFGSAAAPTMPAGVSYQRLQHPDTVTALLRVRSYDLYAGKIYAVGEFEDGSRHHFYDGTRVPAWFDGRARASIDITGGSAGGSVTSIAVGGVEVLGATVAWTGTAASMATALANQINTYVSAPEETAVAVNNRVTIIAAAAGPTPNGLVVTLAGTNVSVVTPLPSMAGGATAASTFQPGTAVKTLRKKMFSVSGPLAHFSGIADPTKWTTDFVGAGFVDLSQEALGSENLAAIGKYQQYVAFFADRVVQIWYMDPDPAQNKQIQVLENTGTISPRSVTQFGDNDLFYLDSSGVRSLKARDASNAAAATDIGSPVDPLIIEAIQNLSVDELQNVIGLIEPSSGRFWLSMKDQIFVFSYFPGAKVSAWSTYSPGFPVEDMVVFNRKVYLRSGDTIYVFGGTGAKPAYDTTEAEVWLPYLDAGTPAKPKKLQGVDVACRGTWEISMGMMPGPDLDVSDKIATVTQTTYNAPKVPASGETTHFGFRFKSKGAGPAILASGLVHFESESKDD